MNRVETPYLQLILSSNSPHRPSHYGSEEPKWRGFVFEQNQSSKHNCWWCSAPRIASFDAMPLVASPYDRDTIRTSPTRVTHSPLLSNPFSGLMLPESLAPTGNFESTALHSEPSYSLYGASCASRQHILPLKRRIFFL